MGFLIRKGKLLHLDLDLFEDQSETDKWVGLNIILASLVFIFYGIMFYINKTNIVSHLMLVIISIFFVIRTNIGPDKSSDNSKS